MIRGVGSSFTYIPATLELGAAASSNVVFLDSHGILILDNPSSYSGMIAPTGSGDEIVLSGISLNSVTSYSYSGDSNSGTLTIQSTSGAINLGFSGHFLTENFTLTAGPQNLSSDHQAFLSPITARPRSCVGTNDFAVNGRADILWTSNGGALLWTNSGAAFGEVQLNGQNGAEWSAVGIGHDHSSTGELVWSNGSGGNINVWQLNGTALSGAAVLPGHMGAEWHVEGLGDFNGDGNTDVLWRNTSGNVDVWSLNGLSLNSAVLSNGQIGAEWHVAAIGDFYGTGRDAILWENTGGNLQSWSMNGANVVATANVGQIGAEWHVAGVSHFPNVGPTDIVWVNTNNDVQIWQMTNGVISNVITPAGHNGTEWHLESINDFTGDANSDLLWLRGDGTANIWQINGSQIQSSIIPGPHGDILQFQASADPSSVQSNATTAGPSGLGFGAGSPADQLGQQTAELPTFEHSFGGAGAEWHILG